MKLHKTILVIVGISFLCSCATPKKKVSTSMVGEGLCDLFINSWKFPDKIEKIKNEFSISGDNTKVYLCLSALYFLSYIRASQVNTITIPPKNIEKISHSLFSFLITKYIVLYKMDENIDVLLKQQNQLTQKFMVAWDKNINNKPSPHWYVGKEVCNFLKGTDVVPDPAFIMFCSGTFSNDTILIKNFLEELQENFEIVE